MTSPSRNCRFVRSARSSFGYFHLLFQFRIRARFARSICTSKSVMSPQHPTIAAARATGYRFSHGDLSRVFFGSMFPEVRKNRSDSVRGQPCGRRLASDHVPAVPTSIGVDAFNSGQPRPIRAVDQPGFEATSCCFPNAFRRAVGFLAVRSSVPPHHPVARLTGRTAGESDCAGFFNPRSEFVGRRVLAVALGADDASGAGRCATESHRKPRPRRSQQNDLGLRHRPNRSTPSSVMIPIAHRTFGPCSICTSFVQRGRPTGRQAQDPVQRPPAAAIVCESVQLGSSRPPPQSLNFLSESKRWSGKSIRGVLTRRCELDESLGTGNVW